MSCKRSKRTASVLEDLEPALWGTLPPRVLERVFLRLPVAQIGQLRLLSKLWKVAIDSVESDFNQLLEDNIYPDLFGLIGMRPFGDGTRVWMFDVNPDRMCLHEINHSVGGRFTVCAADGGLLCFVSVAANKPLRMVVMNPLTGKKVELPRLLCIYDLMPTLQPTMLQLKMNRKTNEYQVFFVGYIQSGKRGLIAQVYDSRTKEWSLVGSRAKSQGCISGYLYDWDTVDGCYFRRRRGLGLYDFADGRLHQYSVEAPVLNHPNTLSPLHLKAQSSALSYALLQDQPFFLHTEEHENPSDLIQKGPQRKYMISEYHLQHKTVPWVKWGPYSWLKGGSHACEPFLTADDYPMNREHFLLQACNGYLMVMALSYRRVHVWLYNLSTHKWHVLRDAPRLDDWFRYECPSSEGDLMCELRWSAKP